MWREEWFFVNSYSFSVPADPPPPPLAPPTGNDFEYGVDEEIYDTADQDLELLGKQVPPSVSSYQQQQQGMDSMEDIVDEDIYDTMDMDIEEGIVTKLSVTEQM